MTLGRSLIALLAGISFVASCVDAELGSVTQRLDGCDGSTESYIDENGEEVICVYTEEPSDDDASDDDDWGDDDWGDEDWSDDGWDDDGGTDTSDPCAASPELCGEGGEPPPPAATCRDTLFTREADGYAGSQEWARISAIEGARALAREACRNHKYYVGYFAYCDSGVPDQKGWSNANSFIRGCTVKPDNSWVCRGGSTVFCSDYTYHAW